LAEPEGLAAAGEAAALGAEAGAGGAEAGADDELALELKPEPVIPPVAPVLAIREEASLWVVQVMLVPGLLTRGRAKH